jgi:hypothetical protein
MVYSNEGVNMWNICDNLLYIFFHLVPTTIFFCDRTLSRAWSCSTRWWSRSCAWPRTGASDVLLHIWPSLPSSTFSLHVWVLLRVYLTLFPCIIMVVGSSYTKRAAPAVCFGHTIIVSPSNPVNCFINSFNKEFGSRPACQISLTWVFAFQQLK